MLGSDRHRGKRSAPDPAEGERFLPDPPGVRPPGRRPAEDVRAQGRDRASGRARGMQGRDRAGPVTLCPPTASGPCAQTTFPPARISRVPHAAPTASQIIWPRAVLVSVLRAQGSQSQRDRRAVRPVRGPGIYRPATAADSQLTSTTENQVRPPTSPRPVVTAAGLPGSRQPGIPPGCETRLTTRMDGRRRLPKPLYPACTCGVPPADLNARQRGRKAGRRWR
jgi:hypothetical protein